MGRKHTLALSLALALGLGIGVATYPTQPGGTLVYAFLVDAGEVAATGDLCDVYSSNISGANSWCLRPDGGYTGEALSAFNSPTLVTRPVCGNGADCALTDSIKLNGTSQYYATASVPAP